MATLSMIVAASENDAIGRGNALPWHLPQDLKNFRAVTLGKPIVMGRKTFASIGRALPGRSNIVVTRDSDFTAEGVTRVHSLEDALAAGRAEAARLGVDEIMLIGGAQLYAQALPRAQRLYLTRVHAVIEGDVFLPAIDWQQWREVERQDFVASPDNPYAFSFLVYEREQSGGRKHAVF